MKIVINACHGGFNLSKKAVERYAELKGIKLYCMDTFDSWQIWYHVPIEVYENYKDEGASYEYLNDLVFDYRDIPRDDPTLIQVIKELGKQASGFCSKLKIVNIPKDVKWQIEEYDGLEWVAEQHRTWS